MKKNQPLLLSGESWRPVNGVDHLEISDFGRLRSVSRTFINSRGVSRFWKARILHPSMSGRYRSYNYRGTLLLIHRVVALAFVDNPDSKLCVKHKDGNKLNNRANNLEWVTRSENMLHAYATGLIKPRDTRGVKNPRASFTVVEVRQIRLLYSRGFKIATIAKQMGRSWSAVGAVAKRQVWKHLE